MSVFEYLKPFITLYLLALKQTVLACRENTSNIIFNKKVLWTTIWTGEIDTLCSISKSKDVEKIFKKQFSELGKMLGLPSDDV